MKLGVPTLNRYDLLQQLLDSAERGTVKPDGYVIVDNGGEARARLRLPPNTQLIEPGRNLGVAASWNLLLDAAGDEPIVISNDDITLGHGAFAALVKNASREALVTGVATPANWSLFVQPPECTRVVGHYDEHFWPAYYEDNDYAYRIGLCGFPRREVRVEATHVGSATIKVARHLLSGPDRRGAYYQAKWGGTPGHERFTEPFGGSPPDGWGLRSPPPLPPRKRSIHDYMYRR